MFKFQIDLFILNVHKNHLPPKRTLVPALKDFFCVNNYQTNTSKKLKETSNIFCHSRKPYAKGKQITTIKIRGLPAAFFNIFFQIIIKIIFLQQLLQIQMHTVMPVVIRV